MGSYQILFSLLGNLLPGTIFHSALPIILTFPQLTLSEKTCYFPNGDVSGDIPCSPDDDESICCGRGWVCYANRLCMRSQNDLSSNNTFARGSCTDHTWLSESCPRGICDCTSTCYPSYLLKFYLPEYPTSLFLHYVKANLLTVVSRIPAKPWTTDGGQDMNYCGDGRWCCQPFEDDSICCSGNDILKFSPPLIPPTMQILSPLQSSTPVVVSTVLETSVITVLVPRSTSSLVATTTPTLAEITSCTSTAIKTSAPSSSTSIPSAPVYTPSSILDTTQSSRSQAHQTSSLTPKISSSQANSTSSTLSSRMQQGSSPSLRPTSLQSTTLSATDASTPPSSPPTSAAKRDTHKTAVGLGIGLCIILISVVVGVISWGIRKQRRRNPRKRKLKISRPITIMSIPMFEVANSGWEMPVDRDMPAEMSANRRTEQTWI